MQRPLKAFSLIAIFFLFAACEKHRQALYNVFFYSNDSLHNGDLTLYINNNPSGTLKYISNHIPNVVSEPYEPIVEDTAMLRHAIQYQMPSGSYRIAAKDSNGNFISGGTVGFSPNEGFTTSNASGGMGMSVVGNNVIICLHQ